VKVADREARADALLRALLDETIGLAGGAAALDDDSPLLGALPELDSMGVAAMIAAIEDATGVPVDDGDITADTFATFASLRGFVAGQLENGTAANDGIDPQPRR